MYYLTTTTLREIGWLFSHETVESTIAGPTISFLFYPFFLRLHHQPNFSSSCVRIEICAATRNGFSSLTETYADGTRSTQVFILPDLR